MKFKVHLFVVLAGFVHVAGAAYQPFHDEEHTVLEGHQQAVLSVLYVGDKLVSVSRDSEIRFWDVLLNCCFHRVDQLMGKQTLTGAIMPIDSARFALVSNIGSVTLWNAQSGSLLKSCRGNELEQVKSAIWLSDGKVACSCQDRQIKIRDFNDADGKPVVLAGHQDVVNVLVEVDPGVIASASNDGVIHIWDLKSEECLRTLTASGAVTALVAQKGTKNIVSADEKNLTIWDAQSGCCLWWVGLNGKKITQLIELKDGRIAAAACGKVIEIYDIRPKSLERMSSGNGACAVSRVNGFEDEVRAIAQLGDGRLAIGLDNGIIVIWGDESLNIQPGRCWVQ